MENSAVIGIDGARLWAGADALRSNMVAVVYKHIVLGLIFVNYIETASRHL